MLKRVVHTYYAHRSNYKELMGKLTLPQCSRFIYVLQTNEDKRLRGDDYVNYSIIKYNINDNTMSLIECEDWDTAKEPTVGKSHCYKLDGSIRIIKGGTKVYHNKWQFVSNDYKGFDIEEAKLRTQEWNSIPDIKEHKKKIGSKKYWLELLETQGMEP